MATARFGLIILTLWIGDLVLTAFLPLLRSLADPLLLFLIYLGLRWPAGRFLWLHGVVLGFLRDLSVGGIFGGWACAFGFSGWALTYLRHLVEAEDPLIVGVCAGFMTLWTAFSYTFLMMGMDPAIGWGHGPWLILPFQALLHGSVAVWAFPRIDRFLKIPHRPTVPSQFRSIE